MPDAGLPEIRPSRPEDVEAIQAIYGHHVLYGLASFEEVPPDAAEMARRREAVLGRGLPFIVAEVDGEVLGFAYAAPYRERAAYRNTLEDSVYVRADAIGRGIGGRLLAALLEQTAALGYRQMLAVIGDSGNAGSIGVHARAGFRDVGVMRAVGFKHGRWVDVVIMQRAMGEGDAADPGPLARG
jgi:phosphinothricin acetyltransferase